MYIHKICFFLVSLVNLYRRKDLPHEPEAREIANNSSSEEEEQWKRAHVAEKQYVSDKPSGMQLQRVPVKTVQEHVQGGGTRREHGSPPPSIVLSTQLKIAKNHANFSTRDDKDQKH